MQLIGHVIEDHQQDMRRLEMLDIPGCDNVFGQWYDPDPDVYWRMPRMASSVAHYARLAQRHRADRAFRRHRLAHRPAGNETHDGLVDRDGDQPGRPLRALTRSRRRLGRSTPDFWLHGNNPQWPYFPEYQAAANRMTMLMRGGRHVAAGDRSRYDRKPLGHTTARTSAAQHGARDDLWKTCAAMSQAHVDFDLIPYYVFCRRAQHDV